MSRADVILVFLAVMCHVQWLIGGDDFELYATAALIIAALRD